ncbi:MAG: hypothetical protein C0501_19870 [Isosphaera sp.]|nr:hypothetical protein [Isosphaera sp.]
MSRLVLAALSVALAAPLAAAPVPADGGKNVPLPFPAKAPVVVVLNGVDTARARLDKLLTAAVPKEAGRVAKLLDDQLGTLFEGRKLTAVRKDARLFLVLNDLTGLTDETPAVSVLVPVTGYKDFLGSFLTRDEAKGVERGRDGVDSVKMTVAGAEATVHLVDLKEYAAVSVDRGTAEGYAGKYAAATAEQFGPDLAETFLRSDLAAYVNLDAINQQFGDEIRGVKGLIDFALQQAQQQGALPGMSKKQLDAMKVMFKGLVQGVEDCRGLVAGAEFRPDGLFLKVQARFADGSETAKTLAAEPPGQLADLARLPAGLGTYTAVRLGKGVGRVVRDLSQELVTTDDDARGAELIEGHLKDVEAAGPGAEFAAALPPDAALTVTAYKDADKAAKALAKAFKAVAAGGRVGGAVLKAAPRVGDEAEKYKGFTFASVNLTYDFDATVAGLPEEARGPTLEILKRTTAEKSAQWIGSDGKVVVRVTAKDWAAAARLLDQYLDEKAGVGSAAGFRAVRSQLPAEANVLLVAEVGSALTGMAAQLKTVAGMIPGFPEIRAPKKPAGGVPTYAGAALTLKGETATLAAYVPAPALATGYRVIESLFKKVE